MIAKTPDDWDKQSCFGFAVLPWAGKTWTGKFCRSRAKRQNQNSRMGSWSCRPRAKQQKQNQNSVLPRKKRTATMSYTEYFLVPGSQNIGLHRRFLKFLRLPGKPRSLQPLHGKSQRFNKFMVQANIFWFQGPKTLACIVDFLNF